jgi:hypothetical protein
MSNIVLDMERLLLLNGQREGVGCNDEVVILKACGERITRASCYKDEAAYHARFLEEFCRPFHTPPNKSWASLRNVGMSGSMALSELQDH